MPEHNFQPTAMSGTFVSTASVGTIWGHNHSKRPLLVQDELLETPRKVSRRMSSKISPCQLEERHRHEEEEEFNRQLDTFFFQIGSSDDEVPMVCDHNEASASAEVSRESVVPAVQQAWTLGGRAIHSSHRLGFTHGVSHCWLCGAWCVGTPARLVTPCRAPTKSGVDSIWMLSKGGMPHRSIKTWPDVNAAPPRSVDYFLNPYGGPHRPKVKVWVPAAKLPFQLLVRGIT